MGGVFFAFEHSARVLSGNASQAGAKRVISFGKNITLTAHLFVFWFLGFAFVSFRASERLSFNVIMKTDGKFNHLHEYAQFALRALDIVKQMVATAKLGSAVRFPPAW